MPSNAAAAAETAYEKARSECKAVQIDRRATEAQRDAARQPRDAMFAAHASAVIVELHDRTELLQKLIEELQRVIDSIEENPISDLLDRLAGAVTTVNEALAEGGE